MSANQAGTQAMGVQGSAAPSLAGINGWLLLPAVGMPLGALLYVINIIQSLVFRFSSDYADVASQYGGVGLLTTFELLGKIGLFIYLCIIAYTFYKQKKNVPKRVITYLIASLIFAAIRFVWGIIIFGMDDESVLISLLRSTGIIGAIVAPAVWIPYFKKSQRVKLTFVNA